MKKGFTLVELIVVIAIIGVLAAIIIPTLIGYIRAARLKADIATAKRLYEAVEIVISRDSDAEYSMHAKQHGNRSIKTVTVHNGSGSDETYEVAICALIGAKKGISGTVSNRFQNGGNNQTDDFCAALTKEFETRTVGLGSNSSNNDVWLPMKVSKIGNKEVNTWHIVIRRENGKETNDVEIWAAHRPGDYTPLFRIYPNPCIEYLDEG